MNTRPNEKIPAEIGPQIFNLVIEIFSPAPYAKAQAGFQLDALSYASDWLIFFKPRFDWLRAPSSQHQFESLSKITACKNGFNRNLSY